MRLEKNFPSWFAELRPVYGPYEAAMDRFIKLDKKSFIGKQAAVHESQEGPKLRRVTFSISTDKTDVMGDEPVWAVLPDQFDRNALAIESPHGYGAPRFDINGNATAGVSGQQDGEWTVIGWITSGGYGHTVNLSLAQGYIPANLPADTRFQIEILGQRCDAHVLQEPPFDPTGSKMRS